MYLFDARNTRRTSPRALRVCTIDTLAGARFGWRCPCLNTRPTRHSTTSSSPQAPRRHTICLCRHTYRLNQVSTPGRLPLAVQAYVNLGGGVAYATQAGSGRSLPPPPRSSDHTGTSFTVLRMSGDPFHYPQASNEAPRQHSALVCAVNTTVTHQICQ